MEFPIRIKYRESTMEDCGYRHYVISLLFRHHDSHRVHSKVDRERMAILALLPVDFVMFGFSAVLCLVKSVSRRGVFHQLATCPDRRLRSTTMGAEYPAYLRLRDRSLNSSKLWLDNIQGSKTMRSIICGLTVYLHPLHMRVTFSSLEVLEVSS